MTVSGDNLDEGDETVVLRLSSASGATLKGGGSTLDATGTITDDDGSSPGTTTLTSVESGANKPGATTLSFTVACATAASGRPITDYEVHAVAQGVPSLERTYYFPASMCGTNGPVTLTGLPLRPTATTWSVRARARAIRGLKGNWSDTVELATLADPVQENAAALTASFAGVPSAHTGNDRIFSFTVNFNVSVDGGQAPTKRSFETSNGSVMQVVRVSGKKWTVHVRPGSWRKVGIALRGGRSCDDPLAVCATGGRALTNSPQASVGESARIRVSSHWAREAEKAVIILRVRLSRAVSHAVQFDFATRDITGTYGGNTPATADADYTAVSGTRVFSPGETEKIIKVPVTDDAHEDSNEVFLMVFSNPQGADLYYRDSEKLALILNTEAVILERRSILDGVGAPQLQEEASSNADLSGLAASTGTGDDDAFTALALNPVAFEGSNTAYTAAVAGTATHVRLTPTAADPGAKVRVGTGTDLAAVTSGTASGAIELSTGENAVRIEVTSEDGKTIKVYTLTLTRGTATPGIPVGLGITAGDAKLDLAWTAPSAAVTGYDAHYTSAPKTGQGAVADDADASGNDASTAWVAVTRSGTAAWQTISSLSNGTAYRVRVRATNSGQHGPWAFGTGTPKSADATLSALTASGSDAADGRFAALDVGTFASGTAAYAATVENAVTHVKLTPTASDPDATVKVGKGSSLAAVTSGSASGAMALDDGANEISVEVTAEDGTTRTYTITVTRAAPPLTARFRTNVWEHDGETSFMLELVLSESLDSGSRWPSAASFRVKGGSVESVRRFRPYLYQVHVKPNPWKDVTVTLAGGQACYEAGAICTADGRSVSNTPTLTVAAPERELSADADLSGLSAEGAPGADGHWTALDVGTFAAATTAYAATVPHGTTHVRLTATAADANATLKAGAGLSLTAVTSGSASGAIALDVGPNEIKVEVTAEDGTTTRTYAVTVTRDAAASTDATLSALSGRMSTDGSDFGGTLDIGTFAPGTVAYTATVGNAVTHVKLTPTASDPDATVTVGRGTNLAAVTDGTASSAIPLSVGANALKVEVTAEDGATRTYTVTVTREAAAPDAPTSLGVAEVDAKLDLVWTAPSGTVTGYDVHYTSAPKTGEGAVADDAAASGNDASVAWVAVERSGTAASQAISSLSNGTTYRVRVRATNSGQDGPWAFGTGTPKSGDATLSALTASSSDAADGTFAALDIGTFASGTTAYAATVENAVTHVKLTPAASVPDATVRVGKGSGLAAVTSGSASGAIALEVGPNEIKVEVAAEDGTTTRTYTVTVTRDAAASTDATLSALSGRKSTDGSDFGGTLDIGTFAPGTVAYTATVGNAVTHVKLTPTASDPDATVKVGRGTNLAAATSGSASAAMSLSVGENALKVEVTAEDGTTRSYTVTVTRAAQSAVAVSLSTTPNPVDEGSPVTVMATLAKALEEAVTVPLTVTRVTSEDGDHGSLASITLPAGFTSATGTVTTSADDDGDDETFTVALGSLPSGLVAGTASSLEVTIADGGRQRTAPLTLSGLSGSTSTDGSDFGGTLDIGTFAPGTTEYTAMVGNAVTHVKLTPAAEDPNATVKVGKGSSLAAVASWSASGAIALEVGANEIKVEVTAGDGTTKKTYTVTVTRKAAASADATLSAFSGSTSTDGSDFGGTLGIGTFESETTAYAATVASTVTHVRLTPTASDPDATVKVGRGTNLAAAPSGSASEAIPVEVGETALKVEVTAGDGTTMTYTVTVTRPWTTLSVSPGDSTLGLSWLVPTWMVTGYDVHYTSAPTAGEGAVSNDATAGSDAATAWVPVARSGTAASQSVTGLDNGTGYRVRVRATSDGGSSRWVTGTGTPRLIDTTLSALSVSTSADGTDFSETLALSPAFAASTRAYTATVENAVTHVKVTPAANDRSASVTIGNAAVARGSSSAAIELASGDSEISVTVTGWDGATQGTYTLTVTRKAAEAAQETLQEAVTVTLSATPNQVDEGSPVTVTATLSKALQEDATIPLKTTGGTSEDGDHGSLASITLPAGFISAKGTVPTSEDGDGDDETFTVALDTDRLPAGLTAGDPSSVQVTISDNGAQQQASVPLTASFENVPLEHDGEASIPVDVRFSHALEPGGKPPVVESFDVTAGKVTSVQKVEPGLWRILLKPKSWRDLTVTLVPSTGCDEAGAPCTADGQALSEAVSATIIGPARIRVDGARAKEGEDASLDFAVTLSRAASGAVSVDYATADETATAGEDYTAVSGTLTFAAGETAKTVSVPVLDDAVDEGKETLRLLLSNPQGAYLRSMHRQAKGVISNTDPVPGAWLSRFGRTVAEQHVTAVRDRLAADRTPGFSGRFAGQPLPEAGTRPGLPPSGTLAARTAPPAFAWPESPSERQLETVRAFAIAEPEGGEPRTPPAVPEFTEEERLAFLALLADAQGPEDGEEKPEERSLTEDDVLLGTSFTMARDSGTGLSYGFWGRAVRSGFSGRESGHGGDTGSLSLDGETTGVLFGADWKRKDRLVGVVLSQSQGTGTYSGASSGGLDVRLTSVVPYAGMDLGGRPVWGAAGLGFGDMTLTPEGGSPARTGIAWRMAAAGIEGALAPGAQLGGADLSWHADALWTRTTSRSATGIAASSGETTRLRLGLKVAWERTLASGATLRTGLETGLRHDGGDAETGYGLEIGGGLGFSDPARGLAVSLDARTLALHEDGAFGNWGLGLNLAWDPAPETKRGWSITASHGLGGSSSGGVDALLGPETFPGLAETAGEGSWSLEGAYGRGRGHGMVGSPYGRMSGTGEIESLRLGYRIEPDASHAADITVNAWADPAADGGSVGAGLEWKW